MRVFMTGATGAIGSRALPLLIKAGHEVTAIGRSPRAYFTSLAQEDAATAVVAALDLPSGTYNVAENEPMRRGEWVASLAKAAGYREPRPLPRWLTRMAGGSMELLSRSLRISNRKLREATDWEPVRSSADRAWSSVLAELNDVP